VAIQPSILVVDDDAATRGVVTDMLAVHGYDVIAAANGQEALSWLDAIRPDAILLDLVMPVMDGFEFLRVHFQHPQRRAIPVIVLSGVSRNDHRWVQVPSVRVVSKPFTEAQLVAAIEAECGHIAT
jgi:CheY-like chemotaxis protein